MTDLSPTIDTSPPRRPKHIVDEGYGRAVKISFGAHIAFFAFVIFKSLVFPSQPKPFVPSLRVDMVDLPDALKKDLTHLPPTPSSKQIAEALKQAEADAKKVKPLPTDKAPPVEKADPDEMVLKPKKTADKPKDEAKPDPKREKKLMSALDRIKALSKIESETKSEARPASPIVKGNKISKGQSLLGDAKEATEASYYESVQAKLQENWELPVWLSRQNLSAQVRIFIDPYGRVRSYKFMKASGNAQFDSAIKKTLEDSAPFPAPPEKIAGTLQVDGIVIGFPL